MVESLLHKVLKEAVKTQHAAGYRCLEEDTIGFRGKGCLRVDLSYLSSSRHYLVECETKPKIPRLQEKGRRRIKIRYRNVYVLVMPSEEYVKRKWSELRGYFDLVYAYDVKTSSFTAKQDLRALGAFQDVVLDAMMPVIRSKRFRDLRWWLDKKKNMCTHCVDCIRGRGSPWPNCWHNPCLFYKLVWGKPDDHWEWSP